jgi:hypothetical protein
VVAYLAFTNEYWVVTLKRLCRTANINFWSPAPRSLLGEIEGAMLYFYAKDGGTRRFIVGRGKVQSFRIGTVKEAWECYGDNNGAVNLRIFLKLLNEGQSDKPKTETSIIGWHILDEVIWRPVPLDTTAIDVPVKLGTWRGRRLKPLEEQRIMRDPHWE